MPNDHKATAEKAQTGMTPEGAALAERTGIRDRLSRTRRTSIYGDLIAGPEIGHDWLTTLAETVREIVAERQREWEAAVLRRCVETMPAAGEAPDFIQTVTTAMLALRPSGSSSSPGRSDA